MYCIIFGISITTIIISEKKVSFGALIGTQTRGNPRWLLVVCVCLCEWNIDVFLQLGGNCQETAYRRAVNRPIRLGFTCWAKPEGGKIVHGARLYRCVPTTHWLTHFVAFWKPKTIIFEQLKANCFVCVISMTNCVCS